MIGVQGYIRMSVEIRQRDPDLGLVTVRSPRQGLFTASIVWYVRMDPLRPNKVASKVHLLTGAIRKAFPKATIIDYSETLYPWFRSSSAYVKFKISDDAVVE